MQFTQTISFMSWFGWNSFLFRFIIEILLLCFFFLLLTFWTNTCDMDAFVICWKRWCIKYNFEFNTKFISTYIRRWQTKEFNLRNSLIFISTRTYFSLSNEMHTHTHTPHVCEAGESEKKCIFVVWR